MAAWGNEFYFRVLKVSLTSEQSERVRDTFSKSFEVNYIDADEIAHVLYTNTESSVVKSQFL